MESIDPEIDLRIIIIWTVLILQIKDYVMFFYLCWSAIISFHYVL